MLLLAVLTAASITYGAFGAEPEEPIKLPAWFWNQPDVQDVQYAVGYAPLYARPLSSNRIANADAALRLWQDRSFRVYGGRGLSWEGSGLMSIGAFFRFEYDTTGLARFEDGLYQLDSAIVGDLAVVLVGTKEIRVDGTLLPSPTSEAIQTSKPSGSSGTAAAPLYARSVSSWLDAERSARIELALSVRQQIRGETAQQPGHSLYGVLLETDVILKDVRTIRRAWDQRQGVIWVIVAQKGC